MDEVIKRSNLSVCHYYDSVCLFAHLHSFIHSFIQCLFNHLWIQTAKFSWRFFQYNLGAGTGNKVDTLQGRRQQYDRKGCGTCRQACILHPRLQEKRCGPSWRQSSRCHSGPEETCLHRGTEAETGSDGSTIRQQQYCSCWGQWNTNWNEDTSASSVLSSWRKGRFHENTRMCHKVCLKINYGPFCSSLCG